MTALALALLATAPGCDELPHDMGVRWQCVGTASRDGFFLGAFPPDDIAVCANPDVGSAAVDEACQGRCEEAYRAWGWFTTCDVDPMGGLSNCHPSFTLDADCFILTSSPGSEDCSPGSVVFQQGGPAHYEVGVHPDGADGSNFTLTVRGHEADGGVTGRIEYSVSPIAAACPATGCGLQLSYVELHAEDVSFDFGFPIGRKDVTGMVARNAGLIRGALSNDGTFEVAPLQMRVTANFDVNGDHGSITLTNPSALTGHIDRASGAFTVSDATFSSGDTSMRFTLRGRALRHPPGADFSAPERVECSSDGAATVLLAASGTPDAAYFWVLPDGSELQGRSAEATLPLGEHVLELHVIDRFGGYATSSRTVVVADDAPPLVTAPADIAIEACVAIPVDAGMASADDACDGALGTSAAVVEVNGVPADVALTPDFAFPLGETLIRYAATDGSGNIGTAVQSVVLAEDASCCRVGLVPLVGTSAADILVSGNRGQCILGAAGDDYIDGRNAADQVLAGPGNDVVLGSNGRDDLEGGPGDDVLEGGNGNDVLTGGPGRDEVHGGRGSDVLHVRAACEAMDGEVLDGGPGPDRLESPLSLTELLARGVIVVDIEQVVFVEAELGHCL